MAHWWQDPEVEARLAIVYEHIVLVLLGACGWEYVRSFGVEYAVMRGHLRFRWPLIPYLLGRLCLLISLILLAFETSPLSDELACQPTITLISVSGGIVIGTSSTNFMFRTWVMWNDSRFVHILLLIVALGHWSMLALDATTVKAYRSNGPCVMYLSHPTVSAGVFVYTVCYDLLVLILSIVKLSQQPHKSPLKERLRAQGIQYFAVATMAIITPTVFAFLDSSVVVGITSNPAIAASAIVSCRAVRSLLGLGMSCPSATPDENNEDGLLTTQPQFV